MSKIGKKTIEIPSDVTVTVDKDTVKVSGPKGNLECTYKGAVNIKVEGTAIAVTPKDPKNTQFQGLYRSLINNMIEGVKNGVSKKLEFNGIGYKANVNGDTLVLNMGYSHPVVFEKIDGISFNVTDNVITVSGIDKVLVGDVAAKIRAVRKPEPYKGKGIKYQNEVIIRKETKSA